MNKEELIQPSTVDLQYWLTVWNRNRHWTGSDDMSGKWMVHVDTMAELDDLYWKLRDGMLTDKKIPAGAFKTSTALDPGQHQPFRYFACVYVEDYKEEEETLQVLKGLREIGIKGRLVFKRDRETFLRIYGPNSFYMTSEEGDKVEIHEPHGHEV